MNFIKAIKSPRINRSDKGLVLLVIYILFALSPLAPLGMHFKVFAHEITGECSGDCSTCGCPVDNSSAKTCCCWQKKLKKINNNQPTPKHICSIDINSKKSCSQCPRDKVVKTVQIPEKSCCATKQVEFVKKAPVNQAEDDQKAQLVFKCGFPCGNGKMAGLAYFGTSEQLPVSMTGYLIGRISSKTHQQTVSYLHTRYIEPPDPPPKV